MLLQPSVFRGYMDQRSDYYANLDRVCKTDSVVSIESFLFWRHQYCWRERQRTIQLGISFKARVTRTRLSTTSDPASSAQGFERVSFSKTECSCQKLVWWEHGTTPRFQNRSGQCFKENQLWYLWSKFLLFSTLMVVKRNDKVLDNLASVLFEPGRDKVRLLLSLQALFLKSDWLLDWY